MFAEIDVDPGGAYQDHRITQPGYLCLNCGAPAVDLGRVPAEMAEEQDADELASGSTRQVLCPVCESLIETGPEDECPNCGAPLG